MCLSRYSTAAVHRNNVRRIVMEIPVAQEYQDILRSDGPDGDSRKRGRNGETSVKHTLMGIDDKTSFEL
jgi:hypothetical protein